MPAAMPQQLDDDFGFQPDDDDFGFQPDAPAQEQPVRANLPPLFDTTQTPVQPEEPMTPFMLARQPATPTDPTSAFADPFPAQPEPEGETAFQGDNEFHYNSRKRTWESVGNKDAVFDPGLEHTIVPGTAYDRRPVKAFAAGVGRRMASLPAALADISEGEHPLQGGKGGNIEAVMEGRKPSYVADYENIKKAAPVLSRTGLFHNAALEMAPKLAAVVASGPAAPASAAVLFGFDNDGNFHPEMAAINAALPIASKFVGNAAMRLAARTGLDNATALNVVNAGSRYATGNAVLIAQTLPGWDKMSPEEKDRAVDNILINALSGFADFQGVKAGPKRAVDYNKAATGFIQAAEAARRGETPNVPQNVPRPNGETITTPTIKENAVAAPPPVEPPAPVRPTEAVAEPMRAIQEVSAMEPLTFGAEITKRKGGLTGDAYRLGERVSTEAEVAALKTAQEAAQAQSKEARGKGDFNAAIAAASKNQYFREAHEYATGTGSAAHGQRDNPNYKPKFTAEGKLKGETADVPAPKPDWEVTVQNDQGEVPGFVQIVDPKATEQSKSPTMESLRAAGHEVPDFSKLPQGKYTYEEAVAKLKDDPAAPIVDQPVNKPAETQEPLIPEIQAAKDEALAGVAKNAKEGGLIDTEMVGMGGAVASEFTPSRQGATGIKNAAVDEARQARGEEPLMQPARLSNPVVWDRVMARIDAEPAWQDRLILELRDNPRTLTPDETLAMDHRYVDMQNDFAKTTRELAQAYDDAKQFPERAEAIPELETRLKLQSDALLDFEQITKNVGTEWGRSGQIRQRLMNEDYSLARMTILKRAENEGRDLTRAENETIARQSKEILELKAKLDAMEATKDSTGAETASKQAIPELVKEAMAEDATVKRSRKGDTPQEARDRAEAGLRSRVENGQTGLELTNVIQRLAKAFVRMGVKERVPLVDAVHGVVEQIVPGMKWRQTMDAISGYGDFRQLSKDQVSVQLRDLKGQMQQAGKLLDMFEGQAPAKTGPERRTPTDTERRLIQQVNEAKKRFGITTTDPATQLKGALQSLKTRLRNQIADLEEQLASKTRRVDERAPVPEDAESTALKAQRDKLKAEFDEMFGKPEMSDENRVKLALASIERQSVEIERQIKEGDIFPVNRITKTPQTAAIEAAKAKRDALKLEREYLRESIQPKEKLSQEEISLKALKTRMANRIAELQDKLAKGDFSKKERKPVQMDDAAKQLSFRLDKAKREFHEGLMKDRLARRATWKKVLDGVGEVMNVFRALKTSFDLPPIFRQGGFMTMSRPTRSIKAAGTGLQAMRPFEGKVRQHATMEEIQNRPNAPLYRSSGLYLSDRAGKLSQMEEAYRSRWATKIPGVGMSERGYTTYLNKLRADSFDALAKSLSRDGQTPTPAEAKVIANFINVATGRGRIGKNDIVGELVDKAFFAPRYWASRIQLLTGQPIWTTSAPFKGTMRARAAVAGEYGRALAGMAVVYALAVAAGALIEKDTRSSDFGKLKFGDRRSDMMAGLQQQLVFLSRLKDRETKNSRGKIVPLADQDGKKVPFGGMDTDDLIKRLMLTKLAPVPAMVLDEFRGKNLVGQPLTVGSRIQSAVGPMTMMDIFQAMKEEGVPTNVALSILSAFGAGMQTYPDKNPKPETPR